MMIDDGIKAFSGGCSLYQGYNSAYLIGHSIWWLWEACRWWLHLNLRHHLHVTLISDRHFSLLKFWFHCLHSDSSFSIQCFWCRAEQNGENPFLKWLDFLYWFMFSKLQFFLVCNAKTYQWKLDYLFLSSPAPHRRLRSITIDYSAFQRNVETNFWKVMPQIWPGWDPKPIWVSNHTATRCSWLPFTPCHHVLYWTTQKHSFECFTMMATASKKFVVF